MKREKTPRQDWLGDLEQYFHESDTYQLRNRPIPRPSTRRTKRPSAPMRARLVIRVLCSTADFDSVPEVNRPKTLDASRADGTWSGYFAKRASECLPVNYTANVENPSWTVTDAPPPNET